MMSLLARKGHQTGRHWPRSLLFMTSLLIPGTPHYMRDQHIIAMFSDWIVYKCLYRQQKPSTWCTTALIWMWPANYVLSDMLLGVLILDRVCRPASARPHLLLLSNRSLGKYPLACQCVNLFSYLRYRKSGALLRHHLLCMRFIISWGKAFFLWRLMITYTICSQYAQRESNGTCYGATHTGPARETCHILFRSSSWKAMQGRWFTGRGETKATTSPPFLTKLPLASF